MATDKWLISIDRPVDEGVIDVTDNFRKITTDAQRLTLFRWIAKDQGADCALLFIQSGVTGQLILKGEYYAPVLEAAAPN